MPKVVVITGGSSGIGHATAKRFASRGDSVVIAARNDAALRTVAEEIDALPIRADVSRWDDVKRVADETIATFGRIDVWINNASVGEWATIETAAIEDMQRIIEVDLLGTMWGVKAVLPHFRQRNAGVIINVASALADRAIPLLSTYCAAKAGVKALTDSLRMELIAAGSAVRVMTILPSSINTPFYTWGRSRLGVRPHPVSIIYPPDKVARAIVRAADHPRREVYVGIMGKLLSIGERVSPVAMDWYMLRGGNLFRQQLTSTPDRGESNLFESPGEVAIEGDFVKETGFKRLRSVSRLRRLARDSARRLTRHRR